MVFEEVIDFLLSLGFSGVLIKMVWTATTHIVFCQMLVEVRGESHGEIKRSIICYREIFEYVWHIPILLSLLRCCWR